MTHWAKYRPNNQMFDILPCLHSPANFCCPSRAYTAIMWVSKWKNEWMNELVSEWMSLEIFCQQYLKKEKLQSNQTWHVRSLYSDDVQVLRWAPGGTTCIFKMAAKLKPTVVFQSLPCIFEGPCSPSLLNPWYLCTGERWPNLNALIGFLGFCRCKSIGYTFLRDVSSQRYQIFRKFPSLST